LVRIDGLLGNALIRVAPEHPLPATPTEFCAQLSIGQQPSDRVA